MTWRELKFDSESYDRDDMPKELSGKWTAPDKIDVSGPPKALLLKPCPFCGSLNLDPDQNSLIYESGGPETYDVECVDCGALGPHEDTLEEAIEAWNKRAGLQTIRTRT